VEEPKSQALSKYKRGSFENQICYTRVTNLDAKSRYFEIFESIFLNFGWWDFDDNFQICSHKSHICKHYDTKKPYQIWIYYLLLRVLKLW
jgi:hypothetical protein